MNTALTMQPAEQKASLAEGAVRLFPLIFVLALLPLIVRVYPYYARLSQFPWFSPDDFHVDFFLHGKMAALNGVGIYMLVLLIGYALLGKLEKRRPWILIPVAVYAVFSLASSALSPYSEYAFGGNFEGFESVWSVLTYCLIVVYAYYMIRSVREIRVLLYSFSAGVLLLSVIGICQSAGCNPLSLPWITALTIPAEYREALEGVVEYNDGTYLTLYNTNYVGVYMAMTVPVLLFLIFDFDRSKSFANVRAVACTVVKLVFFSALSAAALYMLFLSESEAGVLALCAGIVFLPVVLYRKLWKHKLIALVSLAVVIGGAAVFGRPFIQPAFDRLFSQLSAEKQLPDLTRIHADENGVTFTYKGADAVFRMEEVDTDYFVFAAYDGNGEPLRLSSSSWVFEFADEPYSDFSVSYYPVADYLSMSVWLDGHNWVFTNTTGSGTYQLLNYYDKWVDLADPETFTPLDGHERLFSRRGYIWSRSIPLLKQSAVLGIGADCFVFAFPQLDYLGRAKSGYVDNQVFTKPHDLYLQIAIQYGIPALLAFLIFFGMYFFQSFKLYSRKCLNGPEAKAGLGIFVGMVVYMITGLTNDSMIVVSPLFWTLMGIGLVANDMMSKKDALTE